MTTLWRKNGALVKSAGGALLDCENCPCDGTTYCDECCTTEPAATIEVEIPVGFLANDGCTDCDLLEGVHSLPSIGGCNWEDTFPTSPCVGPGSEYQLTVTRIFDNSGPGGALRCGWQFSALWDVESATFQSPMIEPGECSEEVDLEYVSSGGFGGCTVNTGAVIKVRPNP